MLIESNFARLVARDLKVM